MRRSQLAAFETVVGAAAMQKFLAVAPSVGPVAVRASCEVAVALGTQLDLPARRRAVVRRCV
jgi:hypothetical protein